jgi:restriction endonuclease
MNKQGGSFNKKWTNKDINKERRINGFEENKIKVNKTNNTDEPFFGDWSNTNSKIVISVDSEDESLFSDDLEEELIEKEILNESFDFGEFPEIGMETNKQSTENEQEMSDQQEFIEAMKEDYYVLYLAFPTKKEAEEYQMKFKHLTDASTIFES